MDEKVSTSGLDKFLVLLTSLYITAILINLTIGYRFIAIGSFSFAGGIFVFPFSFIIGDIITEIYGYKCARQIVWVGIACQFIFALSIYLIIHMPSPSFWYGKNLYMQVMSGYLRFTMASTFSIIIGSYLNIYLVSKWKILIKGKYFWLRSLGASSLGELFVTVTSLLIADFGKMSNSKLISMMVCCYLLKTLITILAIWPAAITVFFLKRQTITPSGNGTKLLTMAFE